MTLIRVWQHSTATSSQWSAAAYMRITLGIDSSITSSVTPDGPRDNSNYMTQGCIEHVSGCCGGFDTCFIFLFLSNSSCIQGNVWVHTVTKQDMKQTVERGNVTSLAFKVNLILFIITAFHPRKQKELEIMIYFLVRCDIAHTNIYKRLINVL